MLCCQVPRLVPDVVAALASKPLLCTRQDRQERRCAEQLAILCIMTVSFNQQSQLNVNTSFRVLIPFAADSNTHYINPRQAD